MFGPLTLIARDPIIFLVLVGAFLSGLILHNLVQARLLARLGDDAALRAGFGALEPPAQLTLLGVLWYLLFGFGLPRTVPLRLTGRRAVLALLAGPLTLLLWALLLMVVKQVQQTYATGADVVGQGLDKAALASGLHALYFLVPLPPLDGGRALWAGGGPAVRRVLGQVGAAGPIACYILWLVLTLSGVFQQVALPLTAGLRAVTGLLPF